MATIVTLCDSCRAIYEENYRLKMIPGKTTTAKSGKCDNCKKPFRADLLLKQYLVSGKGGKG